MASEHTPKQSKPRKLTKKQRDFIEEYIANKENGTQAALKVYETNETTAASIAYENLRKPQIQAEIDARYKDIQEQFQQNSQLALNRILELVTNASDEKVALAASKDILDRAGHKPVEKSVSLSQKKLLLDI